MPGNAVLEGQFVYFHFVDEKYHEQHSQLLHKHNDTLELFYVMKGEGQYIVAGKKYFVQSGNLAICNAGIMHGEQPFHRHNMESYCCVLKGVSLQGMAPNTPSRQEQNPILYFSDDRAAMSVRWGVFPIQSHGRSIWRIASIAEIACAPALLEQCSK